MPKKDFKNNPALAFIGTQEEEPAAEPQQEPTPEPAPEKKPRRQKQEFWRVCLNLRPEYKEFVSDEAWKARKNVTEYFNDLVAADIAAKQK